MLKVGSHKNITSTIYISQFNVLAVPAELPKEMTGSIWIVDPAVNYVTTHDGFDSYLKPLVKCDFDISINGDEVTIEHSIVPIITNNIFRYM